MIQKTIYRPDTCDCILAYLWNDQTPPDIREHVGSEIISACPEHPGIFSPEEFFKIVLEENQTKNSAIADVKAALSLTEDIEFSYDENRKLTLTINQAVDLDAVVMTSAMLTSKYGDKISIAVAPKPK
jgi:hypothetical protein